MYACYDSTLPKRYQISIDTSLATFERPFVYQYSCKLTITAQSQVPLTLSRSETYKLKQLFFDIRSIEGIVVIVTQRYRSPYLKVHPIRQISRLPL